MDHKTFSAKGGKARAANLTAEQLSAIGKKGGWPKGRSRKEYYKHDHTHCWMVLNPPCGIKGKHRCCLCEEPVPPNNYA
jgi:hypothetical protein